MKGKNGGGSLSGRLFSKLYFSGKIHYIIHVMIGNWGLKSYLAVFYSFLILVLSTLLVTTCRTPEDEHKSLDESEISAIDPYAFFHKGQDLIMNSYNDPVLKEKVLAFFEDLTGSYRIAEAVLSNASVYKVAPALAFALCAEESSYNPQAYNRNRNNTIDRGLFQLNSSSFPQVKIADFYNIELNARLGIAHLRWCLDTAGTEVAALAMYNAGTTRVQSHGTPRQTLDYISRILTRQDRIERLFLAEYHNIIFTEIAEEPQKTPYRLKLLTPLGGR